ncbi:MAG TPA: ABC transporter ATP-binding protein [Bdellovibrionota bacterium]|jgi:ATP-binding cassette subfamily B protein|nr:ABC transporter ATP-binding protein [Bdellovibrionota bacterium]
MPLLYKIIPDINRVEFKNALETSQRAVSFWWRHIKSRPFIYFVGCFSVAVTNAADIMVPKATQWIIDHFIEHSTLYMRGFWALLITYSAQMVARYFWRITLARETHLTEAKLKSLMWNRVRFLPEKVLQQRLTVGELMNVGTGDLRTARFLFGFTLVGTTDFLFLLIFSLVAMFTIDIELTLAALAVIPLVPFAINRLAKREHLYHQEAQERLSELTDASSQAVATIRLQRLSQTGAYWTQKLLEAAKRYQVSRFRVLKNEISFIPNTGIAPLVSYAVLIFFGAHKVYTGEFSIGAFVAMQSYIFIVQGPLIELGYIISEWQRGFASLHRYLEVLNEPEEPLLRTGGEPVVPQNEVYSVEGLTFAHDPAAATPLLHELNLNLRRGDRLGIIGPVGAGKTTLIRILAGFEKDYAGRVNFFGKDIRHAEHLSLRQQLAVVPQKAFLFADSLRNNVQLELQLSDDELWHYLELAGLADDVRKFSNGLDTALGEWGINLSGGQKQRLTIARALAAKSSVILFDDCLSAVDTVTEDKILRNLDEHFKDQTLVWVAHRKSTLKYCNQILELGGTTS